MKQRYSELHKIAEKMDMIEENYALKEQKLTTENQKLGKRSEVSYLN